MISSLVGRSTVLFDIALIVA